ncbi:MAG: hypothetical protein JWL76_1294 [Thermoleophilia bacterium]|nr:hypothetical protein [Thermoleophilia bacterium]
MHAERAQRVLNRTLSTLEIAAATERAQRPAL